MCGISGFYNIDGQHPPGIELAVSWALLSNRGKDAAGAMWQHIGAEKMWSFKSAGPSYNHVAHIWEERLSKQPLRWAAFHARASTGGPATDNLNNHPVAYGNIRVMHNGIVGNDDNVFKKLGVPRNAKVDTEAIAACLALGGIEKVVELCDGSMSLAWVHVREPDTLHLYTNGRSPLWASREAGWLSYASTDAFMPEALVGDAFEVKAGEHVVLRPNQAPEVTQVGIGKMRVWVGWGGYPNGKYDCYNLKCNLKAPHHHTRPEYTLSVHTAHGGSLWSKSTL